MRHILSLLCSTLVSACAAGLTSAVLMRHDASRVPVATFTAVVPLTRAVDVYVVVYPHRGMLRYYVRGQLYEVYQREDGELRSKHIASCPARHTCFNRPFNSVQPALQVEKSLWYFYIGAYEV